MRALRTTTARMPRDGAALRSLGVTKEMVRSGSWVRTSRDHHRWGAAGSSRAPEQRILDAAALVPEQGAFTGWAAALLAGVATVDGRHPFTMAELPVLICLAGSQTRRRPAVGVSFSRGRLGGRSTVCVEVADVVGPAMVTVRLPIATPARAVADGMRSAADLAEAVALADACLHAGWLPVADLQDHLDRSRGARGVRRLRTALPPSTPPAAAPGRAGSASSTSWTPGFRGRW